VGYAVLHVRATLFLENSIAGTFQKGSLEGYSCIPYVEHLEREIDVFLRIASPIYFV